MLEDEEVREEEKVQEIQEEQAGQADLQDQEAEPVRDLEDISENDDTADASDEEDSGQGQDVPEQPSGPQAAAGPAGDSFKADTVKAAVNASSPESARKAKGGGEDAYFDQLPLNITEEEEKGGADKTESLKSQIENLRRGNLYKAVLVARTLKEKKKNPLASTMGGRVSRFLDSSALDTAADLNMIAGSGLSMLTSFETNSAAKTTFQAMSLVTNLLAVAASSRNMAIKLRKLYDMWGKRKGEDKAGWLDWALTVAGALGDALTVMTKGVAIAKTIMALAGKNSKIMNMISNAMFLVTGTVQIIGAANSVKGLYAGITGLKKMKKASEGPRTAAMKIVEQKNLLTAGQTESWSESDRISAAKELLYDAGEGEEKEQGKDQGAQKPAGGGQPKSTEKKGKKKLTQDERDVLVTYLGMTKRITKMETSIAVTATSLVNLVIGLASTGVSGANTIVNGRGIKDKTLKDATVGMGMVANSSVILSTSAKVASKAGNAMGSRRRLVRESLWEKADNLTRNHHGLKWLAASLAKPPKEQKKVNGKTPEDAARETVNLYQKTEGQYKAMGVPYGKLFRSSSLDKFKNLLVDSL